MGYELVYTKRFLENFDYWARAQPGFARKISDLTDSILLNPRSGIGKPERLRHFSPAEIWSRRISNEHRLMYRIENNRIILLQARYHYN